MKGACLALCVAAGSASASGPGTLLYLGEYKFNDPRLYVMEPGGANVQELSVIPAEDWLVVGLQVDPALGRVYWTHGSFGEGRVRSAGLDGSDPLTIASGLANPRGLALDAAGGRVYWSDTQDNRVYRKPIAGGAVETVVDLDRQPGRPTLDLANSKLYFGTIDAAGEGDIRRCDLDGSNVEILFGGLYTPVAVALDLTAGKIYWADANTSFVSNHIARADLDGGNMEVLYEGEPTSSGFTGIGLDRAAGRLYWSDEITDVEKGLWEAALDGTGPQRIWESPSGWNAGAMTVVMGDPCPWDLNGCGSVDIVDLLTLLSAWGTDPGGPPDFDGSGDVGVTDLLELVAHWGACP